MGSGSSASGPSVGVPLEIFSEERGGAFLFLWVTQFVVSLFQAEEMARKASKVGGEGAQLLPCSQSYSHGYFCFSPQAMLKADALGVW